MVNNINLVIIQVGFLLLLFIVELIVVNNNRIQQVHKVRDNKL